MVESSRVMQRQVEQWQSVVESSRDMVGGTIVM